MKRHLLTLAAVLAFAALVVGTAVTAVTSASGAPVGDHVVTPPRVAVVPQHAGAMGECTVSPSGTASALRLTGACNGTLTRPFSCVRGETLALSTDDRSSEAGVFYLTLVIPEFEGAGDYFEVVALVQVTSSGSVARWVSRGLVARVATDGAIGILPTVLLPQVGTPASGKIEIRGRIACEAGPGGPVSATVSHH